MAILSVELAKRREVSPSMAGLLTNPAARAIATMPVSQAEIEEKTKEKEKKTNPCQFPGSTFENNISLNRECIQGSGCAGRLVSDLISEADTRPSCCQARQSWLPHGPHQAGALPGKMFLLEGSTDAQLDLQGSDEQMFFFCFNIPGQ